MRVLFVDIDTLRPDHFGCYGYHRNTSPNIDRLASEGMRFENYYTSDAPCLPSRAALVTGQFGIHTGVINHGGVCADMRLEGADRGFGTRLRNGSIWGQFWRRDYLTASISTFPGRHSAWWFNAGMNEKYDIGYGGGEKAHQVTPVALDWIDRHAEAEDWLLHVNYWDPHTPYNAPESFGNPFANDPLPDYFTEERIAGFKQSVGGHSQHEVQMFEAREMAAYPRQPSTVLTMGDARRLVDGYDCGIRYADDHVGMLLDALAAKNALDDCVIIVTSDHGENLCELDCCAEHGTADHITCRIPMIIRWPDRVKAGTVDRGLHYSLDLAPTLAEMCGFEPQPFWDGQSYARSLTNQEETGRPELILSQCCHGQQRAVRWDDWIYIRTYHDFYHLWPREMLFNVNQDPHEIHNLAENRPDLCREAVYRYLNWHDAMMATSPSDADPLWTVAREGGPFHSRGALPAYCKRLQATGRGQYVEALKRRHPNELVAKRKGLI